MEKYYIATKLENYKQHNEVADLLDNASFRLTYDWTEHGPVWKSGVERIKQVSQLETLGVADADFVVVLLPGGRGTHVELGMAIAFNKPVILWSDNERLFSADPETCAFYHHPLVFQSFSRPKYAAELIVGLAIGLRSGKPR